MNRLNLDFSLVTTDERTEFLNTYLSREEFQKKPLTETELETLANYILWGKNPETGKNIKQEGLVELESKRGTWDSKDVESLDALRESPTFRESQIQPLSGPVPKIAKQTFSREEARAQASPEVLAALESLWHEIDKTDLIISYYEIKIGKKEKLREALAALFTQTELDSCEKRAARLNQFQYLKLRHHLVDLRREQFTYRDTYRTLVLREAMDYYTPASTTFLDADIPVLPFGLIGSTDLSHKIFAADRFPIPSDFNESELRSISSMLFAPRSSKLVFDFRELEHLYNAFLQFELLADHADRAEAESTLRPFVETLNFYVARANLSNLHKDLLSYKVRGWKNQKIADTLNKDYNKTYNANYISTIFRQKILKQIAAAAAHHYEVMDNIFFPENFKKCKDCGQVLLLTPDNFMRKAKSKDGFSLRCKKCDKARRNKNG